jgi:hypothetical protein
MATSRMSGAMVRFSPTVGSVILAQAAPFKTNVGDPTDSFPLNLQP